MNNYLKLVHMEIHRFRYILAGLMAVIVVFQFGALIWKTSSELRKRIDPGWEIGMGQSAYFPSGKLLFAEIVFGTQRWFAAPILISIAVLVLYVFLIWYRDWTGKDTFIYRLLMLPTARRNLYLAKGTAIVLFVFGLVAFQLAILPVQQGVFNWMVPSDLRVASPFADVIAANRAFPLLLPKQFDQFLFSYGLGIIAVMAIFTSILLERSYRLIGIVYGVLYLIACCAAILFPLMMWDASRYGYSVLYPGEVVLLELVMCGAVAFISMGLGFRLLSKKITV